jgi:hypothetical protein
VVVLEKDGEDHLDRSCEKRESITWSQGGEEYFIQSTIKRKKANWIGHILRRNCLRKRIIHVKTAGGTEVMIRRGKRRKELLADVKKTSRYQKLKQEASARTLWRTRFGWGYGPVVRQTTERMNAAYIHLMTSLGVYNVHTCLKQQWQ